MLVSPYRKLPSSVKLLASLLAAFLGLWTIGILSFAYFAKINLERTAQREIEDSASWFQKNLDQHHHLLGLHARTLGENPQLIDAIAKRHTPTQLLQVLLPQQASLKLDFIRIISPQGNILISSEQGSLGGAQFKDKSLNRAAQTGLDLSGVLLADTFTPSTLTSLISIKSSKNILAGLIIGYAIDVNFLEQIRGNTSLQLVVLQGDRVTATTLEIPNAAEFAQQSRSNHSRITIGNKGYWVKFIDRAGFDDQIIRIAVLKPTEDFEQSEKQLWLLVVSFGLIGAALVAGGTMIGFRLTQSLSDRIQSLTQATQRLAEGDLSTTIPVDEQDDVGQLADSFNQMAMQLNMRNLLVRDQMNQLEATLNELHQTQSQMLQREKMSALGQMVAGVAHEINNPITFIAGNIDYIDRYSQDIIKLLNAYQVEYSNPSIDLQTEIDNIELDFIVEDLAKILNSVKVGADRIREIVLSLRNFSRLDEAEYKSVDLHQGIENTLMILQHRLKVDHHRPEIKIVRKFTELPEVQCYAGQMNQVFMNILSNAVDAMEEGNVGRSFQDIVLNPNIIEIRTEYIVPNVVQIMISDNGTGIPDEIRSRLFDPFFTTKPVGKGTGLGLSISYQVITEKHHGKLWCEENPTGGTRFVIQIPVQQA
jgi:two-component system, NtrC family, sensor kinase